MVEIEGDVLQPVELVVPAKPTASLPAAPKLGSLFFDSTTGKLKVWTGVAYEAVTSA